MVLASTPKSEGSPAPALHGRGCSSIATQVLRWRDDSDTIGVLVETTSAKLANVVLPEAAGGEVRLGSLWEKDPAVVVFLRHYG